MQCVARNSSNNYMSSALYKVQSGKKNSLGKHNNLRKWIVLNDRPMELGKQTVGAIPPCTSLLVFIPRRQFTFYLIYLMSLLPLSRVRR